jgi:SAM-dependent methyltransferase
VRQTLKQKVRARLPESMASALGRLLFETKAARIARRAAPAFRSLEGRRNLKVHLGAGADVRRGWVNVDLALRPPPEIDPRTSPGTLFINHDLRRGLPLPEGSCDFIYSAHFFEHLGYQEGFRLIQDCYRALAPGGVLRTALPNFPRLFEAYLQGDSAYFDLLELREMMPYVEPGTETLVDHVNYGVYQHGEHVIVYDAPKFILLLKKAGFSRAEEVPFDAEYDQSSELRRRYSFYIEAVK